MFWKEPQVVIDENQFFLQQNYTQTTNTVERVNKRGHIENEEKQQEQQEQQRRYDQNRKILEINERYNAELNEEETSRTPLIEPQEKPQIGKRFKRTRFSQ